MRQHSDGVIPTGTNMPPIVETREPHRIGGRYDTLTGLFIGPCETWRVWLIGEKQFDMLFSAASRHCLLFAAEGAGKTTLMGMMGWKIIITASMLGLTGCLGATAPTSARMTSLIEAMTELAPISTRDTPVSGAWGTLKLDAGEIQTCSGHLVRFRSTKRQSAATGSPLQSYNFGLGILMDEIQDSLDATDDALARLRSAPNAPLIGTCTAKDTTEFRTFRESLSPEDWTIHRIDYRDAFAVHMSHWDMLKRNLSPREWRRRALALDSGPERMTFNTFQRDINLGSIPLNALDVTEKVLARYGKKARMLVGRDPGVVVQVSVLLKAYQVPGERRHRWYIVGEVNSPRATEGVHIADLMKRLHSFECDPSTDYGQPVIRFDPTTKHETYTLYRKRGLIARPAAFKPGTNTAALIAQESRIEMTCSLLENADGEHWLYMSTDDRGKPSAPSTLECLEMSERDAAYRAEAIKKGDQDNSHWGAALGYALWLEEKPRMGDA